MTGFNRLLNQPPPPFLLATAELAFCVQFARLATRSHLCPLKINAPNPPTPENEHTRYFGCPIRRAKSLSMVFSTVDVALPFLTANEKMWQFFEPDLRRNLSLLTSSATAAERTRGALLELLPAGDGSMHAVCRKLGMSERTLQRRLTEDQLNFQPSWAGRAHHLLRACSSARRHWSPSVGRMLYCPT